MNPNNAAGRYGPVAISLHWLTLALLIGVYACINLTDLYAKGSPARASLQHWHFMLGLTILVLVALRLLNRVLGREPEIVPPPAIWQQRLARATHVLLYVLLLVMPLLGWLVLSASGKPVPFFGLQLPALLAEDKNLAGQLKEVHETIGTIGYFLIGAHAAAALLHHFVARDNTLVRMLPAAASRRHGP